MQYYHKFGLVSYLLNLLAGANSTACL